MAIPSFTTIDDVYPIALIANKKLKISDITQEIIDQANRKTATALAIKKFYESLDDIEDSGCYYMLQGAAIAFAMELLNRLGIIKASVGDIKRFKQGNFEVEYQPHSPLFFFAEGNKAKFTDLLPHQTWYMEANDMINGFLGCYTREKYSKTNVYPSIWHDDYARGYGRTNIDEHPNW